VTKFVYFQRLRDAKLSGTSVFPTPEVGITDGEKEIMQTSHIQCP